MNNIIFEKKCGCIFTYLLMDIYIYYDFFANFPYFGTSFDSLAKNTIYNIHTYIHTYV